VSTKVIGTGTTQFGIQLETSPRSLAARAVAEAVADAGVQPDDVGLVVVGSAAEGLLGGQEMIRAQTALSTSVLQGRPMMSVENACASSSSAFYLAWLAVESGEHDVVAVVGVEKMSSEDRSKAGRALASAVDVEEHRARRAASKAAEAAAPSGGESPPRPVFMEIYAKMARDYADQSGATAHDFALVVEKSSANGARNPIAQNRAVLTAAEVLEARTIVPPLTRPMCSSISDGAAAVILVSDRYAKAHGLRGPSIRACVVRTPSERGPDIVELAAAAAFERASIGPADVDLVELHDAAAPAELMLLEKLGLAHPGEAPKLLRTGATAIGGALPVNPSGGLLSRGHPIGATGLAQIAEITNQLRGRAGERQVAGARIGLTQNAGGSLFNQEAACVVTVLEAEEAAG
jgi:acetyl-CoA acetyltransferase